MPHKYLLKLLPLNQTYGVESGSPLYDILFSSGVEFPCGGHSRCRGCRIKVLEGDLAITSPQEDILTRAELEDGWRLGCQGIVKGDLTLELDQWKANILSDDSTFDFSPQTGFGIAIDLGTTTLAAQLINRKTGEVLGVKTAVNPQAKYGGDIMSRIDYAIRLNRQKELQFLIRSTLHQIIFDLLEDTKLQSKRVERITIVGNAVMHNIFCGIDVEPMGFHPFEPVSNDLEIISASELGWDMNCPVEFLPGLGSFIGSDILAGAWVKKMAASEKINVLVDLGTNGEILVGNNDKILAASTAAGPAFEGAGISMGMGAATGAISSVALKNGSLKPKILGNTLPRGICGSGLVDAVAAFLELGKLTPDGRIVNGESLIIAEPVLISQKDIRELQLAKGAIATGIRLLLDELGADETAVEKVYLSGAFGNYLSKNGARKIGLLNFPSKKISSEGNTALLGAKMALFHDDNHFTNIREKTTHIDLSLHPNFTDVFGEMVEFPE